MIRITKLDMGSKSIALVIISIVFLAIASLNITNAQLSSEDKEKLENANDNIRKFSDKDFRNDFIMEEGWTYFLNKTNTGKIVIQANEGIKKINPFWNLVLGVNYTFSWGFWIAFLIWLTLFFIILPPSEILLKNKLYSILASFAIASLIGLSGIIREATNIIGTIINNKITGLMILLFSITIVVLAKKSDKLWKQLKEKEAKRKEEQSRQILFIDAETVKKKTKKSDFDDKNPYIGR